MKLPTSADHERVLAEGRAAREMVVHPAHYGGGENLYEVIRVIEAWELGFHLGNAVKYIARAGKKNDAVEDLRKAAWYISREADRMEERLRQRKRNSR